MLKNITFSADPDLIDKARRTAEAKNSTLNNEFRRWLAQYASQTITGSDIDALLQKIAYVKTGKKLSRDEMNER